MNCQQATRYIWDYCDNKLSPSLELRLESHCQECEQCQNHLRLTRLENEVLKDAPALPALSPDFTTSVMKGLPPMDITSNRPHRFMQSPGWFRRNRLWTASSAILGTLLMLIVLPLLINKTFVPRMDAEQTSYTDSQPSLQGVNPNNTAMQDAASIQVYPSVQKDSTYSGKGTLSSESTQSSNPASPEQPAATPRPTAEAANRGGSESSASGIESFPYSVVLPSSYQLVDKSVASDNSLVFNYAQTGSDIVVDVIVTRLEDATDKGMEESSPSMPNVSSKSATDSQPKTLFRSQAPSPPSPASNSRVSWSIEAKNQLYRVTLDGNLSPQELALLGGSMKFQ